MQQPPQAAQEVKVRLIEDGAHAPEGGVSVPRGRVIKYDEARFNDPPSALEASASHIYLDYSGTWRACVKEEQLSPTEAVIRSPGHAGDRTAWRSANVRTFQATLLNQVCEAMMIPNCQVLDEELVWRPGRAVCRTEPTGTREPQWLVRVIPGGQVLLVSVRAIRNRNEGEFGERLSEAEGQRFRESLQEPHPQMLHISQHTPLDTAADALLRLRRKDRLEEDPTPDRHMESVERARRECDIVVRMMPTSSDAERPLRSRSPPRAALPPANAMKQIMQDADQLLEAIDKGTFDQEVSAKASGQQEPISERVKRLPAGRSWEDSLGPGLSLEGARAKHQAYMAEAHKEDRVEESCDATQERQVPKRGRPETRPQASQKRARSSKGQTDERSGGAEDKETKGRRVPPRRMSEDAKMFHAQKAKELPDGAERHIRKMKKQMAALASREFSESLERAKAASVRDYSKKAAKRGKGNKKRAASQPPAEVRVCSGNPRTRTLSSMESFSLSLTTEGLDLARGNPRPRMASEVLHPYEQGELVYLRMDGQWVGCSHADEENVTLASPNMRVKWKNGLLEVVSTRRLVATRGDWTRWPKVQEQIASCTHMFMDPKNVWTAAIRLEEADPHPQAALLRSAITGEAVAIPVDRVKELDVKKLGCSDATGTAFNAGHIGRDGCVRGCTRLQQIRGREYRWLIRIDGSQYAHETEAALFELDQNFLQYVGKFVAHGTHQNLVREATHVLRCKMAKLHFREDQNEAARMLFNELTRYAPLLPSPNAVANTFEAAMEVDMEAGMKASKLDEPYNTFLPEMTQSDSHAGAFAAPASAHLDHQGHWVQCTILEEDPRDRSRVKIVKHALNSHPVWVGTNRLAEIPKLGASLKNVSEAEASADIIYRTSDGAWHAGSFHEACSFYACRVCLRDCRTGEERYVLADCVRGFHAQLLESGYTLQSPESPSPSPWEEEEEEDDSQDGDERAAPAGLEGREAHPRSAAVSPRDSLEASGLGPEEAAQLAGEGMGPSDMGSGTGGGNGFSKQQAGGGSTSQELTVSIKWDSKPSGSDPEKDNKKAGQKGRSYSNPPPPRHGSPRKSKPVFHPGGMSKTARMSPRESHRARSRSPTHNRTTPPFHSGEIRPIGGFDSPRGRYTSAHTQKEKDTHKRYSSTSVAHARSSSPEGMVSRAHSVPDQDQVQVKWREGAVDISKKWLATHCSPEGLFSCSGITTSEGRVVGHLGICSRVRHSIDQQLQQTGCWQPEPTHSPGEVCTACMGEQVPPVGEDARVGCVPPRQIKPETVPSTERWASVVPEMRCTGNAAWDRAHRVARARALQEDWRSAGKRQKVQISSQVDQQVGRYVASAESGKAEKTLLAYDREAELWQELRRQKGWSVFLESPPLSYEEANRQAIYWAAYLRTERLNSVGTIRSKQSAVRWFHVHNFKPDPFKTLTSYKEWLADEEKKDAPTEPKLGVPPQLVELVIRSCGSSLNAEVIKCACSAGFWFLLRCIEMLGRDPRRSLTWADVLPKDKDGIIQPLEEMNRDETTGLGLRLFCRKGSLHTCTRSVNARYDLISCPVLRFQELYAAYVKHFKKPPPANQSPFMLQDRSVFTRERLAEVLKAAALSCGLTGSRIATHSLRRGGCSTYYASNRVSEQDLMRFGRWSSTAYYKYVTAHQGMLDKAVGEPGVQVPLFELN